MVTTSSSQATDEIDQVSSATNITPRKKDNGTDPKENLWYVFYTLVVFSVQIMLRLMLHV